MNKRIGLAIASITGALVMAGGVTAYGAVQSIPGSDGLIYGCYQANGAGGTNGTPLNIIDSSKASCGKNQTPISWNQTGPAGPQGPQGPQGVPGATGPAGPGLTFTATLGGGADGPGPQLTSNGTYFVDAFPEFYNPGPDALIANCDIGGWQNGEGTTGWSATIMIPPGISQSMSFTGLITVTNASSTSPVTLLVSNCTGTAADVLSTQPVVQVLWDVAPVAMSN